MTRAAKIEKRKERARKRREKRNEKYFEKIKKAQDVGMRIPLSSVNDGFWEDSDSPTGYSQKCSYLGTCQYPCNGDC